MEFQGMSIYTYFRPYELKVFYGNAEVNYRYCKIFT